MPSNNQMKGRQKLTHRKRGTRRKRNTSNKASEDFGTTDETSGQEVEEKPDVRKGLDAEAAAIMNAFVDRLASTGVSGLLREYAELKAFLPPNRSASAFEANRMRNRYSDQLCYDVTRLRLTYNVPPDVDYIHANIVDIPGLGNRFICAQAPLPDTINDWWRMVFQEKAAAIVMLCKTEEDGRPKCAQYFPLNEGESKDYGFLTVRHVKTDPLFDRAFGCISLEMGEKSAPNALHLHLYTWKEWPDKGVPQSGFGVLRLLRAIRRFRNGNILVYDVVRDLRTRRHNAVQTDFQYLFIHRAICEYIQAKGLQRPQISQFMADYAAFMKTHQSTIAPSASPNH